MKAAKTSSFINKLIIFEVGQNVFRTVNLSFIDGYTTADVLYLWKYGNDKSVEVQDGLMMSQFDLKTVTTNNQTRRTAIGKKSYNHVKIISRILFSFQVI